MRIIAGKYKNRKMKVSKNLDCRPTKNVVREAIFNKLKNSYEGDVIINSSVLDVCCGTGMMSFEAISRGAENAVVLDNNYKCKEIIYNYAQELGLQDKIQFLCIDVNNLSNSYKQYNLVFIDPPYDYGDENISNLLNNLIKYYWLEKEAFVVLETGVRNDVNNLNEQYSLISKNLYGKSKVTFLKYVNNSVVT